MTPGADPVFSRHDIGTAVTLLTRMPVPVDHAAAARRLAPSAWAWPLVGLAVGALAGLADWAGEGAGLPAGLAAALALALQALVTGALHEDGLADCADGFWGGATVARRLEIMRDSRIGSYGTLALALALLARWSAIAAIGGWMVVPLLAATGAASRAAMGLVMAAMPHARTDGLAARAGRPARHAALAGLVLAAGACFGLGGLPGLALLAAALIAAILVAGLAMARIGGQTGDVLGAAQQAAEIAALATAASMVG